MQQGKAWSENFPELHGGLNIPPPGAGGETCHPLRPQQFRAYSFSLTASSLPPQAKALVKGAPWRSRMPGAGPLELLLTSRLWESLQRPCLEGPPETALCSPRPVLLPAKPEAVGG